MFDVDINTVLFNILLKSVDIKLKFDPFCLDIRILYLGKGKLCFLNCPIKLLNQRQFVHNHASKKAELCSIMLHEFHVYFCYF